MIKKVLILGYGSIGVKHKKNLKKIDSHLSFFLYDGKKIITRNQLNEINPDYVIISTPTSMHYKHLKMIDTLLKNKIILVEKPLFEKTKIFKKNKKNNNKIFVGYNLRFHPVIEYLKKNILKYEFFHIRSECYSYLPNWRKKDYTKIYSSKKNLGGGVALDLSHEIDFLNWIFGKINIIFKKKLKISKLKINTDDTFLLIGKVKKMLVNIGLNFSSHQNSRKIFLDGPNQSLICDLNKNHIKFFNNKNKMIKIKNFQKEKSLLCMHQNILRKKYKNLCSIEQAMNVLKIIN